MYKCKDCETVFDEVSTYSERMGECWGTPAYEEFACCPKCESTNFEEAKECPSCMEYYIADDLKYGICESCFNELKKDIANHYRHMSDICKDYGIDDNDIEDVITDILNEII